MYRFDFKPVFIWINYWRSGVTGFGISIDVQAFFIAYWSVLPIEYDSNQGFRCSGSVFTRKDENSLSIFWYDQYHDST